MMSREGIMEKEQIELACTVDVGPGERLTIPDSLIAVVGPGRWTVIVRPCDAAAEYQGVRRHDAFLSGYASADEGLYDDLAR